MTKTNCIHPVLPIICFVILGMTIGTTVAMEKFPFFPALDATKLEAEYLLPRRSGFLRPGLEVKKLTAIVAITLQADYSRRVVRRGLFLTTQMGDETG